MLFVNREQISHLNEFIINMKKNNPGLTISLSSSFIIDRSDDANELEIFLKRPICSAGRTSMMIMPNGKVIPCEQLPCEDGFILGDVSVQSIMEV
jgi:MoaA/NifB/PqqE/SkfB family radical SAM enzyme